jgi:hypothetical protein
MGRGLLFLLGILCAFSLFPSAVFAQHFDPIAAAESYHALHAPSCIVEGADCSTVTWSAWRHAKHLAIAVPLLLLFFTGFLAKWQRYCERRFSKPIVQAAIFALPVALIPWATLEAMAGLSNYFKMPLPCPAKVRGSDGVLRCIGPTGESWLENFTEFFTQGVILWLSVALCLFAARWLFSSIGKRSWIAVAALWSCFFLYSANGSDVFRNGGIPLATGPAKAQIERMATAEDFPISKIMYGIPKTFGNWQQAQVMGLFEQKILLGEAFRYRDERLAHIKFNGLPLQTPTDAMTVALVGHELAHVRQNHLIITLVATMALSTLLCWLGYRFWCWVILRSRNKRYRTKPWSLSSMVLVVPIALFAFNALIYARNPITLYTEREADRVGLDISKQPDGFAAFAVWNHTGRSLKHGPMMQWTSFTHPSGQERIKTAMEWKARNLRKIQSQKSP